MQSHEYTHTHTHRFTHMGFYKSAPTPLPPSTLSHQVHPAHFTVVITTLSRRVRRELRDPSGDSWKCHPPTPSVRHPHPFDSTFYTHTHTHPCHDCHQTHRCPESRACQRHWTPGVRILNAPFPRPVSSMALGIASLDVAGCPLSSALLFLAGARGRPSARTGAPSGATSAPGTPHSPKPPWRWYLA